MSQKQLKLLAVSLGFLAIAPLFGLLIAELSVAVLDCRVAESGHSDCVIGGIDIGMLLAILYTGGWVSMISIPVAGLAALVCYAKYRNANLNKNQ
ncbi:MULTISPECIES: hypothetical protein [Pseudoalteromonas]|uniref:Uncharacterized protein n=1 Tax=Pseudoalteromonas piscicida TaxID=43662 RepID=A0ABM6ND92_PSEO7|nr:MULTISPECIES: hypothetical protein [Pseudoalteromonas]ATD06771.1 hypothetical protein PPIS_a1679 [Pseudoalteromonas piscicida]MCO7198731.1 hypothetical protein [Pseudoalteromonas sp. OANN1]MDP4487486.1 hypothetical protein [Pseudoalteromonas piscicida]WPU33464.1 hypothetical protein SIO17_06960 [Pseudoalteromonas piscicida]